MRVINTGVTSGDSVDIGDLEQTTIEQRGNGVNLRGISTGESESHVVISETVGQGSEIQLGEDSEVLGVTSQGRSMRVWYTLPQSTYVEDDSMERYVLLRESGVTGDIDVPEQTRVIGMETTRHGANIVYAVPKGEY